MRHIEAASTHPHLGTRAMTVVNVARWILYVFGTLAVVLGLFVWPAKVHAVGGVHGLAGWLVIASLWTIAAIAGRERGLRGTAWLAGGWGLVTALGAMGQFELKPGSWITVLHVATGVGAVAWGRVLLQRMHHVEASGLSIKDAAADFLAQKRIAVTGVSSKAAQQHGANVVYRRLRERGYEVFAINPNATQVEGDRCFPDLGSIPGGVDAVVIATRPAHAMQTIRECAELGVTRAWMHRSVDAGSVSNEAAEWGRQRGIRVIAGGCPLMFEPVSDAAHKVMRPLLTLTGKVPRRV